jgi:hypothetical protein
MLLQFVRTLKHAIFCVPDDLGPTCRRPYYGTDQNASATIFPPYSRTYGPTCHPLPPSFLLFSSATILRHHRPSRASGVARGRGQTLAQQSIATTVDGVLRIPTQSSSYSSPSSLAMVDGEEFSAKHRWKLQPTCAHGRSIPACHRGARGLLPVI